MTDRRTQIYLTEDQHRVATKLARDRGTTLAAVVREALDRYLAASQDDDADWDGDPALGLVGCIRAGDLPSSPDAIDDTVYEEGDAWSSPTAPGSSPSSTRRTSATSKPRKRGRRSHGGAGSS